MPVNILAVPKLRVFAAVLCLAACDSPTQPSTVTQQVVVVVSPQRTARKVLPPRLAPAQVTPVSVTRPATNEPDNDPASGIVISVVTSPATSQQPPTSLAPSVAFMACNQGRGNGPDGCDPGRSNQRNPSRDE